MPAGFVQKMPSTSRCDNTPCNGGRAWLTDESVELDSTKKFCSGDCADEWVKSTKLVVQINEPETTDWRPIGRYEDGPPHKGMDGDCAWMWYVDGGYWELVLQPHTADTHLAPLPVDYNTWEFPHVSVPYHLDLNKPELVESLVPGYCHICHELAGDVVYQCKGRHIFCSDIDLCQSCCESAFDYKCPDCNQVMDPVSFPFATDIDSESESE